MFSGTNEEILSSAAISEGTWYQVDFLEPPFSVSVKGFASGDVVQIWVSNEYDQPSAVSPAAGDGTFQYGGDIATDTAREITASYRWLRVRKSAAVAPQPRPKRVFKEQGGNHEI